MRVLAQITEVVLWFATWIVIPAVLLYPGIAWLVKHTQFSVEAACNIYGLGIMILFLPIGFLTHSLYRKFILKKTIPN
jgi:hypothetical protein